MKSQFFQLPVLHRLRSPDNAADHRNRGQIVTGQNGWAQKIDWRRLVNSSDRILDIYVRAE